MTEILSEGDLKVLKSVGDGQAEIIARRTEERSAYRKDVGRINFEVISVIPKADRRLITAASERTRYGCWWEGGYGDLPDLTGGFEVAGGW